MDIQYKDLGMLFKFFTSWSLMLGVIALATNSFSSIRVAMAVNILICSIFGTIMMSHYSKELSIFFSKSENFIHHVDIYMHYIIPLFLVSALLYKLKPYNLGRGILYSLFSVILYSTIIDEREQYGNINILNLVFFMVPFSIIILHLLIFTATKYV